MVQRQQLTVFLAALGVDGGVLSPSTQYWAHGLSACQAADPGELEAKLITTSMILQWRQMEEEDPAALAAELNGTLPTAALNCILTALDATHSGGQPQQYVGCVYSASEGDSTCVQQRLDKIIKQCSMCSNCLKHQLSHPDEEVKCEFSCQTGQCNLASGEVCEQCLADGHSTVHALLRRCRRCMDASCHCIRVAPCATSLDNDSKQALYSQLLNDRTEALLSGKVSNVSGFQLAIGNRRVSCYCVCQGWDQGNKIHCYNGHNSSSKYQVRASPTVAGPCHTIIFAAE